MSTQLMKVYFYLLPSVIPSKRQQIRKAAVDQKATTSQGIQSVICSQAAHMKKLLQKFPLFLKITIPLHLYSFVGLLALV